MAMISSLLWSSREPGHGSKVGTAKTTRQVQDQVKAAKAKVDKVAKVATETIAALNAVMMITNAGTHAGTKLKVAKVAKVATESIALNAPMMRMTLAGETAGSKVKMAIMVTKKVAMKVAMK